MKWLKHDSDANQDAKLQNVLLDYGLEGYGLYWYCIELIANKVDVDCITFELEHDARIIARNTGSTPQKVEEMMRYFVNLGLFEDSTGVITCIKLAKRLDKSMTSNPQMREIIGKLKSHDSIMTQSAKVMQDKIRLEESKDSTNQDSIERNLAKKEAAKVRGDLLAGTFEHWWQDYPRKDAKKKSFSLWVKINKKNDEEAIVNLAELISEDINIKLEDLRAGNDRHFGFDRLLPSTYLNGERWNDDK